MPPAHRARFDSHRPSAAYRSALSINDGGRRRPAHGELARKRVLRELCGRPPEELRALARTILHGTTHADAALMTLPDFRPKTDRTSTGVHRTYFPYINLLPYP